MSDYSFYDRGWTVLEQLKQVNYALSLNNQTIDKFNEVTEELNKMITENLIAIGSTTSTVEQDKDKVHIKVYGKNLEGEEYVIYDSEFKIVPYDAYELSTTIVANNDERFVPYSSCTFAGLYYKVEYSVTVKQGDYSIPIKEVYVVGGINTHVETSDNFTYTVQFTKYGTSTITYGAILENGTLLTSSHTVSCPQPDFATDTWNRIGCIVRNEDVIPYKAGDEHINTNETITYYTTTTDKFTYMTVDQIYTICAINHYADHTITLVPKIGEGYDMAAFNGVYPLGHVGTYFSFLFDEIYSIIDPNLAQELKMVPYPYIGDNYIYGTDGTYRDADGNHYDNVTYSIETYEHYIGILNGFFRGSTYEGITHTAPDGIQFTAYFDKCDTAWDLPISPRAEWYCYTENETYAPADNYTYSAIATTPVIEIDDNTYSSIPRIDTIDTLTNNGSLDDTHMYPMAFICTIG